MIMSRSLLGLGIVLVAVGGFLTLRMITTNPEPIPVEVNLAEAAQADLAERNFVPLSGDLSTLLNDPTYQPIPTQTHPLLGQLAPDFTLPDVDGTSWTLSEKLKDGPVVVVFYYGYYCNHCVSQLFGLNQDITKFREMTATVVAISPDPSKLTQQRFEKYGPFRFPTLSDAQNQVAEKYSTFAPGKTPEDEGQLMHGTFIINRQGRIIWTNRGDGPFTENRTLLRELYRKK